MVVKAHGPAVRGPPHFWRTGNPFFACTYGIATSPAYCPTTPATTPVEWRKRPRCRYHRGPNTTTCKGGCHVQAPSYVAAQARQAREAIPRLPPLRPRRRRLGEEDPRQAALLRSVGRPRRRPGEVPRAEGRPARRQEAARDERGRHHGQGRLQPVPHRQTGPRGRWRTVPAHLARLQGGL